MAWAALTGPAPYRLARPGAMSPAMAGSRARLPLGWSRAWLSGGARRPVPAWRTACSRLAGPGGSRRGQGGRGPAGQGGAGGPAAGVVPGQQQGPQPPGLAGAGRGDLPPGHRQDAHRLPAAAGARHRPPARVQARRGQHRQMGADRAGPALAAAPAAGGLLTPGHRQARGGQRPARPIP